MNIIKEKINYYIYILKTDWYYHLIPVGNNLDKILLSFALIIGILLRFNGNYEFLFLNSIIILFLLFFYFIDLYALKKHNLQIDIQVTIGVFLIILFSLIGFDLVYLYFISGDIGEFIIKEDLIKRVIIVLTFFFFIILLFGKKILFGGDFKFFIYVIFIVYYFIRGIINGTQGELNINMFLLIGLLIVILFTGFFYLYVYNTFTKVTYFEIKNLFNNSIENKKNKKIDVEHIMEKSGINYLNFYKKTGKHDIKVIDINDKNILKSEKKLIKKYLDEKKKKYYNSPGALPLLNIYIILFIIYLIIKLSW